MWGPRKKIALAAVLVGALLCSLTFRFVQGVKTELWEQSVNTIMESTRQGCNTLKVQLSDDYEDMGAAAEYISTFSLDQKEELGGILHNYAQTERGTSLYLPDGTCLPAGRQRDEAAEKALQETDENSGIINPHISSVSGVNVFDLFLKVRMSDGAEAYFLKEYEVDSIIDTFTLSFYNDAGFSYVVNAQGDVLIRAPHPNSNKTVKNLFDMLSNSQNDPGYLETFAQSLRDSRTGWAVFTYQGEETVFCYTPLKLHSDWYLISIIPQAVVNAQTNEILNRSMALIGCIILGISLLVMCYFRYANRTNKRLSNQANYIEHLYNAIPEGIALITAETPYRLIQLNREGLRLLGYQEGTSGEALKGMRLQDIVYAEDHEQLTKLLQNTSVNNRKNVFENRMTKMDGSFFWSSGIIEKTLDEEGCPILIAAFHDITDERMAKEAAEREKLQERLTLVGAISNAYPVIISINLTKDTINFPYVRPGVRMGLGTQKSYSQLYEDMARTVHPENLAEFKQRFAPENLCRALGQKNEAFLEARQRLTDGNYHWTSTQIIDVDNPYSEDKLAILISRSIDEQRYENEQQRQVLQSALDSARAASEAKSQFLSNMSHDIRTPMNAIIGMTAIASAHINEAERVKECLKKIGLSSKHLLSLINDILDMSKIESGKLSLREEPFNFAELVADSVELIRPEANAKQLKTEIHLSALKQEKVVGDPLRIRQVCINILSNAVKYTPSGGSLCIEVKQESSYRRGYQSYVFSCSDTGMGMSQEFLKVLFQPFERAQDSTNSKIMGTGLGMAITKNLVDLMNGDIQVESRQGEGSVFTVTLPLKLQESQQEDVPPAWVGVHCLVVDDDRQTCENTAELFEDMGLRAQFVTTGTQAVEAVVNAEKMPDPYQLVVVDWKMPDMDGVEVARSIREQIGPQIPVIVLTAYDWSEIENEAREAGVTAFMSKPFYRSKICYLLGELSGEKEDGAEIIKAESDYAGKRILLVEDNEINREIARELIREMGIQTEEACDGVEAVEKLADSREGYYDLILMDIQMPRMDGYEATKVIRALERQDVKSMPIIAMTANAFDEDVRIALRSGMDAHCAKPIDMDTLSRLLHKYLTVVKRN